MRSIAKAATLAIGLAAALTLPAQAHRAWLLPSATVISGKDVWVTIDAAVSNDLFYFEHFQLRLENLVVEGPDGSRVEAQNQATGRYRSTFDIALKQEGTYRASVVNAGLFASYKENGQTKRWRGTAENFAKDVPANAQDLRVTQSAGRIETFVTYGKPSVFKPTGKGLEMIPVTHPNDLVTGEPATFQMLLDGQPAADLKIEVVRGGIRYRDRLGETAVTTGKDGRFTLNFNEPGMYWFETELRDKKTAIPQATERRASYAATIEVLPK